MYCLILFQVCPPLVFPILERVVRDVGAELGRLFSCVEKFSESGALQARADLAALTRACRVVSRDTTNNPFSEAEAIIPPLGCQRDQEYVSPSQFSLEY